jgi:molecular chaperone GrpE
MTKEHKKTGKAKSEHLEEEEVTEVSPVMEDDKKTKEGTDQKIKELEKERDDFKDKFLRTYADLENYRKRVAREKEEMLKFSNEKLLKEILFIKDNLDLALSHKDTADSQTLKEGLELISREFDKLMGQMSVEEVKAIGEHFDPTLHEAMAQEESNQQPGTILKEFQKGYLFHGRLLRPARVIVAKTSSEENSE